MPKKNKYVQKEEEILKFWQENKIFEKSVDKKAPNGDYVFYDGPPFATGTPHYGHIVASLMKDTVPRFWTMNGYRVERKWGWDCHGLPIENIVEQELDIHSKKDIEEKIGIDKFNQSCHSKVLMYADEWKKFIPRMGRWVDMERAYLTMEPNYMESIWWVFKQLWDKDLIYESYKSMHICPRCETTLSQSEVTQGYKNIKDLSVVVTLPLIDEKDTAILAWTTTPWTLPGNVALAVGDDIEYVKVKIKEYSSNKDMNGKKLILAKSVVDKVLDGIEYDVVEEMKGKDLVGKAYEPLFDYFATDENKEKGWHVYAADFVDTEEGTGVVHIAPAFGTDDMNLGKENDLPWVQHVDMSGRFTEEVKDLAGRQVKPKEDPQETDIEIIKLLAKSGRLFGKEKYEHSYPHCWRCDSPLLNYATSSWFVAVTKKKDEMLKLAGEINWVPEHIKEGRFGKWLEGAQDWSISRQRFWGSVLPIWKCDECEELKVFGSREELEKASGEKVDDLHKHIMDKIEFGCDNCKGTMKRIPDVLDCWFESGAMPYAQMHYPFENKKKFEENFPAEFIAEGVDQTRAWFYYLLVLSTGIMDSICFKNVIANGIVLAEDGQKMSKKLKNYPNPTEVIDKYGADAMRYYLLTSPVMKAETLMFSEKGVDEVFKKLIMILGNIMSFYIMFADDKIKADTKSNNILDKWILSKLEQLTKDVTDNMRAYDLVLAARPIIDFVDELSTWYIRRSRARFKGDDANDKKAALATLKHVLSKLALLMAPFTPFTAEENYKELGGIAESVHLEEWPESDEKMINPELMEKMSQIREYVEKGLALREEAGIRVRQPLAKLVIEGKELEDDLADLIKDEVNIKEVEFGKKYELDIELTEELKEEGLVREIIRGTNSLRKKKGLTIHDEVEVEYETESGLGKVIENNKEELMKNTVSKDWKAGVGEDEVKIDDVMLKLSLKK
ncbi:isoleucine--tRNA ligase [Patescibacteria group bacterium]|nr:isoleucine--tRNA ligase [Patescibacteria group bacterium]MBU1673764.1 isoleucine--tRNA ligase [Patescibacteria group bacterium]MBU1964104.1 isoleucine--tRNA ligase [Patescibacteria group bacterium]